MRSLFLMLLLTAAIPAFAQGTLKRFPLSPEKSPIHYFQGTFAQFQGEMIDRNKPGFIVFLSDRHWRSKDLEINLNDDSESVALIDSNFVAYLVNTSENYDQLLEYRLSDVPAMVVLDKHLKEVGRIEGKKDTDGLLELLEKAKER